MKRMAGVAVLAVLAVGLALVSYRLGVYSVAGGSDPTRAASPSVEVMDAARPATGTAGSGAGLSSASPPQAASIADVLVLPTDFARTHAAYALAAAAGEAALPALIESARQVAAPVDRRTLLGALVARYGELDPERAIGHITRLEPGIRPELIFRVFSGWAGTDLDAAIAAVSRLDTEFERRTAGDAILFTHSNAPRATLAAIGARLPRPAGAPAFAPSEIVGLAMDNPVAALAEAADLAGEARLSAVAEIGRIWALNDPESAYAHSRTLRDPGLRNQFLGAVLYSWSETAPARVVGLLEGDLDDFERTTVLNMGISQIGRRDPAGAHAQVQEIEDRSVRIAALQRVFGTWAQQDPARAAAALADVASAELSNLPALVGFQFASQSPAEALAWAARFDDGFGAAMRSVVPEVAKQDPRLALEAANGLAAVDDRNRVISSVIAAVAADDPVAATGYWQQLPDELRAAAAARIVTEWRSQDPGAAAEWLLRLPLGPERDEGLRMLVVTGPQGALDIPRLVNAIESTSERDRLGRNYVRNVLIEGDLRGAEAELARLDLSPDGRREAQRLIDDPAR